MSIKRNFIGNLFGRLTVIAEAANKGKHTAWLCRCSCGVEKTIITDHLTRGLVKSCGCYNNECRSRRFKNNKFGLKYDDPSISTAFYVFKKNIVMEI